MKLQELQSNNLKNTDSVMHSANTLLSTVHQTLCLVQGCKYKWNNVHAFMKEISQWNILCENCCKEYKNTGTDNLNRLGKGITEISELSLKNKNWVGKNEKGAWLGDSADWSVIPYTKRAVGSIPSQRTYLGYRFHLRLGEWGCNWSMFLLYRCFFLFKTSKHILGWGLEGNKRAQLV